MKTIAVILLSLILCGSPLLHAGKNTTADIMHRAQIYEKNLEYDKAFELYRTVAGQYDIDMSRDQKKTCLDAAFGCANSLLMLSDYSEAFSYLLLIEEICDNDGFPSFYKDILYSSVYIALASQMSKASYMKLAIPHAKRALSYAVKHNNMKAVYRVFGDLTNIYFILNDYNVIKNEEAMVRTLLPSGNWRIKTSLHYLDARKAQLRKDYGKAVACLDSSMSCIPETTSTGRLRASNIKDRALALSHAGRIAEAKADMDSAMKMTYRYGFADIRLSILMVYMLMCRYNDIAVEPEIKYHYLELKDSLKSYKIADDVIGLENIRAHKDMQKQIAVARYKRQMLVYVIIALVIVILTVITFLIIFHRKNRMLRLRATILRRRMKELYQKADLVEVAQSPKYINSGLSDADKKEISDSIREILNSPAVFSLDFSLNTLADEVGRHSKSVSQVIHEMFDTNFSTLVNRIRIVEACRRIDSEEYAMYSVDGIAESVGFNSRSAFSKNFKKFTGMGIREYRKMSKTSASAEDCDNSEKQD